MLRTPKFSQGFLVTGLIVGLGLGFLVADRIAADSGHFWNNSTYTIDVTITCLIVGPILGLAVGLVLDIAVRDTKTRSQILEFTWWMILVCVLLYWAWPPVQRVRE